MVFSDIAGIGEIRARHPELIANAATARTRRNLLDGTGRLMIIAADHPARGALGVQGDGLAMADRRELLARVQTALSRPGVDGVLGTADVLEDLLLLGALDDKVVIGSLNRGGLRGASFEIDDRFTGYDASTLQAMGFDGGKMLCRIDFEDGRCSGLLESCAKAVTDLAGRRLMAIIEPLLAHHEHNGLRNDLSTEAVITAVSIASALGAISAYSWLKVPAVEDMERVTAATTLPMLLLGGDELGAREETYARWESALALAGVRGLVAGRSLLYPPDDDVESAVDLAAQLVRPTMGRQLGVV